MTTEEMLDAGSVPASRRRHVVTWAHNHKTLSRGDVVVMAVHRTMHYLIRVSDMTLHGLEDGDGQYVHLAPVDEPATPYALAAERLCRAVEIAALLDALAHTGGYIRASLTDEDEAFAAHFDGFFGRAPVAQEVPE